MESNSRTGERENPSPTNSPSSRGSSSNNNNGGGGGGAQIQTPRPIMNPSTPRSESTNPYPTTFVQADTSNFKQVVQMLTGSSESPTDPTHPKSSPIPPIRTGAPQKKQGFKLYERRRSLKNGLIISPFLSSSAAAFSNSGISPRKLPPAAPPHTTEILSPSMLDFPKLVLSPVTPLLSTDESAFNNRASPSTTGSYSSPEEAKAIAEKGFYLHPSPRESEPPQLLPLFPVTSPRLSDR